MSRAFVFLLFGAFLSACGAARVETPVVVSQATPSATPRATPTRVATSTPTPSMITWVDGTRFLFASGAGEARELRLGTIGGASLRVGEFKGDGAMYDFNNPR